MNKPNLYLWRCHRLSYFAPSGLSWTFQTASKILCSSGRIFALLLLIIYSAACAHSNTTQKENKTKTMREEQGVPVVYTALGDSTGVGVGAKQGGGYVARLFERIKREQPQARLNNFCVSGATTEDVLRGQLKSALNSRPTLITLGIGINDIGHGLTAETFVGNYEEIIKHLKEETSARIVVTNIPDISFAPVVPAYARDETRRRVQLFNEKVHAIAERYDLTVVDIYTETHNVIPKHPEFFSEDGFHPSDAGYEYWAKTMWPTVKSAMNQ
ncbi:MAG: acyl-CoA thioesterase [Acidobacteriota bacterium]|nr:acyl-CoA thioesterase [Acidobacteriota bacterium]